MGGEKLSDDVHYKAVSDVLEFKHGETTKAIDVQVNPKTKVKINYTMPDTGADVG